MPISSSCFASPRFVDHLHQRHGRDELERPQKPMGGAMLAAASYSRHAVSPMKGSDIPGHMTVKTSSSQALSRVSQESA